MKKIVFTGGGTAGHVTPNLALISMLVRDGWEVDYIGSYDGIERQIITGAGIRYHSISSGKLRRYFDWNNFRDPFRVVKGLAQSLRLLRLIKPRVIFSKGGFVSVPVVVAGKLLGIPVIVHESDMTPGLANKLSIPFARHVCVTFPETMRHIRGSKAVLTGLPIRDEIARGDAASGYRLCGFRDDLPVVLVMGGSLGSKLLNEAVRRDLERLLRHFQVIHICGKGNTDESLAKLPGYRQFEYVQEQLPDLLAVASVVVSRAGATSISEFLTLRKPMLLIPLSRQASRGDQILNAESFARQGFGQVVREEELASAGLCDAVLQLYEQRDRFIANMAKASGVNGTRAIVELIGRAAN